MNKNTNIQNVKIMNLEGSDILKNNLEGLSINKDYKGAFANSLLLNKLMNLGLKVSKNGMTKDILTINFNYGYTPAVAKDTTEIDKLQEDTNKLLSKVKELESLKKSKPNNKKDYIKEIKENKNIIRENKTNIKMLKQEKEDLCMAKDVVRENIYKNGFKLDFYKKDKETKEYVVEETIDYVFWFRTPSKARVGDVMFINKKLFKDIKEWQRMGLELSSGQAKVVEMGAYESLTSSAIESTIEIDPSSILVSNDLESLFETNCNIVKTNAEGQCIVEKGLSTVKNTIFDGQALLEDSLFVGNEGMMLLRQHFFKACAFRTNIQKFMKDYCSKNGLDYNTFAVKDRYNNLIKVKDIKMITTQNAMKWEKFGDLGANFAYWKSKVNADGNIFGICKTDHASKYGDVQRMSYQMLNTMQINKDEMIDLASTTINYVNAMKDNNELYVNDFLTRNISEVNNNKMIIDLCKQNKKFMNSEFFKNSKTKDLSNYKNTLKKGKLLVVGDNLTVVGNPYLMLLHAVAQVPNHNGIVDKEFLDVTLPVSNNYISVYTKRFADGEELSAFRNPHNSPNNIGYFVNNHSELMEKYFNFSNNIIAINCVCTEIQDLMNGMDFDSDFCFVTNNKVAIDNAKRVFRVFPTIVNKIEQTNKTYVNNMENLALIDNLLAKAKADIGTSSNLAQIAMSWYWNSQNEELADVVCILSVLAQVAIDNAKRAYNVNLGKEITRIRNLDCMNVRINNIKAKPSFWQYISKQVKQESLIDVNCPMEHLQEALKDIKNGSTKQNTINNMKFIKTITGKANDKQIKKIEEAIKKYDDAVKKHHDLSAKNVIDEDDEKWEEEQLILQEEVINYISSLKMQPKTMQILVTKALSEGGENNKFKTKLLNSLYKAHTDTFLSVFK